MTYRKTDIWGTIKSQFGLCSNCLQPSSSPRIQWKEDKVRASGTKTILGSQLWREQGCMKLPFTKIEAPILRNPGEWSGVGRAIGTITMSIMKRATCHEAPFLPMLTRFEIYFLGRLKKECINWFCSSYLQPSSMRITLGWKKITGGKLIMMRARYRLDVVLPSNFNYRDFTYVAL